jgi:malate dehydrogenase (oxaloacetate-decarboxylating)(NADP+)
MDFTSALEAIKPNVLIGATGTPGTFTKEIVESLVSFHDRPAIFALSNPTANAECTAEQAYTWSKGKAIFCSGSPFAPVELNGQVLRPGQGNNAYIFPGIGLGAVACKLSSITDDMFLEAAKTLANMVTESDLEQGTMYPRLTEIRKVSLAIAVSVAQKAFQKNLAQIPQPENISGFISEMIYNPGY